MQQNIRRSAIKGVSITTEKKAFISREIFVKIEGNKQNIEILRIAFPAQDFLQHQTACGKHKKKSIPFGNTLTCESNYVRRMRLELTRRNRHYPLKVACIPISPPAQ